MTPDHTSSKRGCRKTAGTPFKKEAIQNKLGVIPDGFFHNLTGQLFLNKHHRLNLYNSTGLKSVNAISPVAARTNAFTLGASIEYAFT